MYLLIICIFYLVIKLLSCFLLKIGCLSFYWWFLRFPYGLWILVLCEYVLWCVFFILIFFQCLLCLILFLNNFFGWGEIFNFEHVQFLSFMICMGFFWEGKNNFLPTLRLFFSRTVEGLRFYPTCKLIN